MLKIVLTISIFLICSFNVSAERLIVPPANVVKLAHKLSYTDFPRPVDIISIARVESGFKPDALNLEISKINPNRKTKSSKGIMQVQGGSFNVEKNMTQGVSILREYFLILKSKKAAVIAYNIGIGNYKRGKCQVSGAEYWDKFSQRKKEFLAYNKKVNIL